MSARLTSKQAVAKAKAATAKAKAATAKAKPAAASTVTEPVPVAQSVPSSLPAVAAPIETSVDAVPDVKKEKEEQSCSELAATGSKAGRPKSAVDKADMQAWCKYKKSTKGKTELAGKTEKAIQDFRTKWCLDRAQSRSTATESKTEELQDEHLNECGWYPANTVADMEGIPRDTPELQEFLSGLPRQPNDRYPHVRHLRQFDVFHYNAAGKHFRKDIKKSALTAERTAEVDHDIYEALGEDVGVSADFAVNVPVEIQGPRVIASIGSSSSVAPLAPASPPTKPPAGGEEAPKPMQVLLRLEKRGQGLVRDGRNLVAEIPTIKAEKAHLGGLCDVYEVGFKKLQKEMDDVSVFLGSPDASSNEAKIH
eukprot:1864615-Amphidinium_carterae.1